MHYNISGKLYMLLLLGHYIYMESSRPGKPGDVARIISRPFAPLAKSCLVFYYSMFGQTMGRLNVYMRHQNVRQDVMIWSLNGDQGRSWFRADVPLPYLHYAPFQVRRQSM